VLSFWSENCGAQGKGNRARADLAWMEHRTLRGPLLAGEFSEPRPMHGDYVIRSANTKGRWAVYDSKRKVAFDLVCGSGVSIPKSKSPVEVAAIEKLLHRALEKVPASSELRVFCDKGANNKIALLFYSRPRDLGMPVSGCLVVGGRTLIVNEISPECVPRTRWARAWNAVIVADLIEEVLYLNLLRVACILKDEPVVLLVTPKKDDEVEEKYFTGPWYIKEPSYELGIWEKCFEINDWSQSETSYRSIALKIAKFTDGNNGDNKKLDPAGHFLVRK